MKIITIIGARPQFIKAASVSRATSKFENLHEIIVHTGQHFDKSMSEIFFDELKIPVPDYNLNINSLSHGAMTGRMIEGIEEILNLEKPDWVLVYGDTNSTLAGAIAAKKMNIRVAHVEAGLRSFNMEMPEEINRILTDRISDVLFCPTQTSVKNLIKEGYENFNVNIDLVGDVMFDSVKFYKKFSRKPESEIPKKYVLCTIHRAENTDNPKKLKSIFESIQGISENIPVVLPIHPRTKSKIKEFGIGENIILIDPVGYLEMLYLLENSDLVMTDSGGLQKEAYFFSKPCITLRKETEWIELVDAGVNLVCGDDAKDILRAFETFSSNKKLNFNDNLYGEGNSSDLILQKLVEL